MPKTLDKSVTIPPYWPHFTLALIGVLLGLFAGEEPYWQAVKTVSRRALFMRRALIIMGFYILVRNSVHCSVRKKHLIIRFLGIPVRFIRWENISTVQYLYKWGNTKREAKGSNWNKQTGQGLIITLKGCPPFIPASDGLETFNWRHPIGSVFIRFTSRQQKKYVKIFQSYFPELSFQLGYEENFEKGLPYDDL